MTSTKVDAAGWLEIAESYDGGMQLFLVGREIGPKMASFQG